MVKRERNNSDPPTNNDKHNHDRSASLLPKKAKAEKEKCHKAKAMSGASRGKTMWDAERSAALLETVFDIAAKSMDTDAVANKLGVNKSQVVDQLKNGRSNIRRMAIELVRAKKGGA
ncbi:hypothetical protein CcaverHIS002_0409010 [Cutaneotrichosporon cavernicola]|uniref:Uncharacterized protein n=1 Tax=Cutaneotrichosporon cavernicola TaxID=279322 RepID=A0AA48L513_9TREE|nr:uncharacterized protein CcaverHIS019_0408950 [Cutaneotrichosporon cavernicola]BEI84297.1 hypothetical protein CcaverHIS002_0409010 [Cutaneotrichosporon cavernicola]BEI92075.1 hypothetical protein CcaverHIS019_0408950 [Cutaneotrichosporon cavernicola]BEI99845.1 hypothetical protein CcaverHIS631_0408880 [Cutaneotrichosporon cavernicola]BEJ07621.1 hypothetical protein CcaverHIS641_0408900 [Cutaneotrichosporon cavernicola]